MVFLSELKLTAKVREEDENLAKKLREKGMNAKLVRNGVIIDLIRIGTEEFAIPSEIRNYEILINISESGGGMTRSGNSQIVCSTNGKKMKPIFIPRFGNLCNEEHAFFAVHDCCVITCDRPFDMLTIQKIWTVRENGDVRLMSEHLFEGNLEQLPTIYKCYEEAATAALQKAYHYHCREPYYVIQ